MNADKEFGFIRVYRRSSAARDFCWKSPPCCPRALPAALEDYFPGQMDDFGSYEAAIVFLAEMDHVAVGSGIEGDLLVGQEIGVHEHFHVVEVAEGRHGAEIAIGEDARQFG